MKRNARNVGWWDWRTAVLDTDYKTLYLSCWKIYWEVAMVYTYPRRTFISFLIVFLWLSADSLCAICWVKHYTCNICMSEIAFSLGLSLSFSYVLSCQGWKKSIRIEVSRANRSSKSVYETKAIIATYEETSSSLLPLPFQKYLLSR